MLFLVFQLGKDRYALDAGQVAEILPLVDIKAIPGAATGVAGLFNYRGTPVPVIDLAAMALGKPSQRRMSTRIIVLRYPEKEGRLLGLVAERATAAITRAESDFADPGVAADEAPYLGLVTRDAAGIIQRVEVSRLLSEQVRDQLFRQPIEAAG